MTATLRKTIEQAAQTALRDYLQTEADLAFGGSPEDPERCIVSDRWPEPGAGLPKRAISVIPAGARQDTSIQEEPIRSEERPDGTRLYTYRVAVCNQPVQIDIWSCYDAPRDDLMCRLGEWLRQGVGHTLGVTNSDPFRDGVLLRLDPNKTGGYQGFADCAFEGQLRINSARSVQEREYRATMLGYVEAGLTIKRPIARIKRVIIQEWLDAAPGALPATPDNTFTFDTQTGLTAVT